MKLKIVCIGLIFFLIFVGSVNAIDLIEGVASTNTKTQVYLSDGITTFTDFQSGVSGSTTIQIDNERFLPTTKSDGNKITWTTGETGFLGFPDPKVRVEYSYTGKSLKETITIKENLGISFSLTLGKDSKLIPWDNGQWKIVSAISDNTMKGIVLEKPFGIDAKGNRIEMRYTFTKNKLDLVYEKIPISIVYPLVIDPTWTAVGDRWEATDGADNITMWNTTGTTTWDVPIGVTHVEYLVIGGGGGGGDQYAGGGGAGGFRTSTSFAVSGTIGIMVGSGGAHAVNGSDSVFSTIRATGGGAGGNGGGNGGSGGSGGGAGGSILGTTTGGSGNTPPTTPSQGNTGGKTITSGSGTEKAAGGGGASAVGGDGTRGGSCGAGGDGTASTITGSSVYYSGGGGGAAWNGAGAAGGLGGGGAGGLDSAVGFPGTNGLGGGGGGGSNTYNGGSGGSGVVIIRYQLFATNPSYTDPFGYILANGVNNKLSFFDFKAGLNEKPISLLISGSYEVA